MGSRKSPETRAALAVLVLGGGEDYPSEFRIYGGGVRTGPAGQGELKKIVCEEGKS